ncbi:MAG: NlpC/P60 family protein [Amaricoccus sp.]|uniref:NlpC/P60 family protein n=1 Tax=Amaricoccus sp. TaxID=1872485 RepID=UPI0039E382F1
MTDQASKADAIVAEARQWIGTPYRHQASCRGAGTDCLGLLRGVWRETLGPEPERVPSYTADWSEPGRSEDLLDAARRNLVEVARAEMRPGDVLVLRMRDTGVAKHVGILASTAAGALTMVHAYSGCGVVESTLTPAWSRRIAGVFRFPDRSV